MHNIMKCPVLLLYVNWAVLWILKIRNPQCLLLEVSDIEFYQTFLTLIHSLCFIYIFSLGVRVDETPKCIFIGPKIILYLSHQQFLKLAGG
jgi:hypothetical protein